ncbi:MAG: Holliday junction branch migration DNA helicase RuvB [Planctomycetota bacterium]
MSSFLKISKEEEQLEKSLRPQSFSEFIGQKQVIENLSVYVEAAKKRNEALDHILLTGLPGLGKTTIAYIIAKELSVNITYSTGPVLTKAADLVGILTKLDVKDILFIDEIHRIPPSVEEYLYSAMEDYVISITLDKGPYARSVKIPLKKFTLVGSTTREGLLSEPFRARFGVIEKLSFYEHKDMVLIIKRSAKILDIEVKDDAAELIAKATRGIPRIANRILKRIRDFAQVENKKVIDLEIASLALRSMGIDELGLNPVDRKILEVIGNSDNEVVGLKTIAQAVGETEDTIEYVYEPYLLLLGFITRTPKGRKLTQTGYDYIHRTKNKPRQKSIF